MGGKGFYWDNAFVERLWRSVEDKSIYLKALDVTSRLKQELTA